MKTKRFRDSGKDKISYKSKAKLEKMLKTMNVTTIARKCGVTPAAVMYYVRKYKLKVTEGIKSKRLNVKMITLSDNKTKTYKIYDTDKVFRRKMVRSKKFYDRDPWEDYHAEG